MVQPVSREERVQTSLDFFGGGATTFVRPDTPLNMGTRLE